MLDFNRAALICVDWGSSNLRAYLIDTQGAVLDRLQSDKGVLNFSSGQYGPELRQLLQPWLSVKSIPVILAGMVGSMQGWQDAGYIPCPSRLDDLAANLCQVSNDEQLQAFIVPGVKGLSNFGLVDVMRGEEVQIFGALSAHKMQAQSGAHDHELTEASTQLVCLPGTHSKWAQVDVSHDPSLQGAPSIRQFSTYMTGELFALLNEHSILGKMYQHETSADAFNGAAFDAGVRTAQAPGSLLHKLFSARSKVLNQEIEPAGVHSYLSGMLIATEVFDMLEVYQGKNTKDSTGDKAQQIYAPIILVGAPALTELYERVIASTYFNVRSVAAETASCLGILNIAKAAGKV